MGVSRFRLLKLQNDVEANTGHLRLPHDQLKAGSDRIAFLLALSSLALNRLTDPFSCSLS